MKRLSILKMSTDKYMYYHLKCFMVICILLLKLLFLNFIFYVLYVMSLYQNKCTTPTLYTVYLDMGRLI